MVFVQQKLSDLYKNLTRMYKYNDSTIQKSRGKVQQLESENKTLLLNLDAEKQKAAQLELKQ